MPVFLSVCVQCFEVLFIFRVHHPSCRQRRIVGVAVLQRRCAAMECFHKIAVKTCWAGERSGGHKGGSRGEQELPCRSGGQLREEDEEAGRPCALRQEEETSEEQGCQKSLKNINPGSHKTVAKLYERESQLRRTKTSGWCEWFEWG